jgi:hypothetical protein
VAAIQGGSVVGGLQVFEATFMENAFRIRRGSGPRYAEGAEPRGCAEQDGADEEGRRVTAGVEQEPAAAAPAVIAIWMTATINPPPASASSGKVR